MVVNAIEPPPRRVTILWSTGSVGGNTVDLIERAPERFTVEAPTVHRNVYRVARIPLGPLESLAQVHDIVSEARRCAISLL